MWGHTFESQKCRTEGLTPLLWGHTFDSTKNPNQRPDPRSARHMHCVDLMRRLWAIAIAFTLACSKQDDSEKLRKSIDSWSATLQLVADARLKNEVRKGFALKTIEAAVDDLERQTAKTTDDRATRLIGVAAKLRQAVEADDRASIAKARGELVR